MGSEKLSYEEVERRLREAEAALDKYRIERIQISSDNERAHLLDSMINGFVVFSSVFDDKGQFISYRFEYANAAFERITGAKLEDVRGKTIHEVWPDTEDYWIENSGTVACSGTSQTIEMYHGPTDKFYLCTFYRPWDTPDRFCSVFEDITERKRTELALQRTNELLLESQAIANLGSWELDLFSNQLTWSDEVYRIFGLEPKEFAATYEAFLGAVHPDDREAVDLAYTSSIEEGRDSYGIEHRIVRKKSGEIRYVHEKCVHHRDSSGKIVRSIGMVHDITERRKWEEERERLQAELMQAQKMEAVGRLAGGVAHDFNNMLGVIIGHAELALEQIDLTHPLYQDLQEIQHASLRSAELTRQLLAFARKQTVSPKVLDLNDTVSGMLKMLKRLIGEDIALNWSPADDVWPIKMDPTQVDQILANLAVNARDAMPKGGALTIATENFVISELCAVAVPPGEYVELSVSDTGEGIDRDTAKHLFEPFFTTKEVGKGTGLGLATIYGIVKQNSGYIDVYSEIGAGTRFRLYFPRHLGSAQRIEREIQAKVPSGSRATVLVVEDEEGIREVAKAMLERLGYDVLTAGRPGEAIRLAEEYKGEIDLLMTDVVMPEMNGRDLAKQLLSFYPGLKRLFMSGYTADVIAHHGILEQGVHFIQKPFSLKNLAAKLEEALNPEISWG